MAGVERIHHRAGLRRRGLVAKAAQGRSAPLLRDDSVRAGAADPEFVAPRPEQLPGELARAQRGLAQLVHVGVVCAAAFFELRQKTQREWLHLHASVIWPQPA